MLSVSAQGAGLASALLEHRSMASASVRLLLRVLPLAVLFLLCLPSACGDSVVSPSSEGPDAGPGSQDSGGAELEIAPPVLTPCPDDWVERYDEELGIAMCDPWPESSPVRWDCPEGWSPVTEDGVSVCEPWPDSSPVEWACPDGWRRVVEEGVETCDPFPEGGAGDCGPNEAHYPGAAGCTPVGAACPRGDFAEGLPRDANIVYVQPGFQGGDGSSPASPLGSLYEVNFLSLPQGTVVALAKGTHRWTGTLNRFVTLWGACPAETILTSPVPLPSNAPPAVVTVDTNGLAANREVVVKNLRIADAPQWGFAVQKRLRLSLEGVVVERVQDLGLAAGAGGRLSGHDVVIRGTRSSSRLWLGRGLTVETGASAELRRAVFTGNREFGVGAGEADSRLVLEDAVVEDTQGNANQTAGRGLSLVNGATAELRRVVLANNREFGAMANQAGSRLLMEDVVVLNTQSRRSGSDLGHGLSLQNGASAEVRRVRFEGNREAGIDAFGSDTQLVLEDAVVLDTKSQEMAKNFGRGIEVRLGAIAELRRLVVARNRDVGLRASGANTRLVLEDAMVRDTQSLEADGTRGWGLAVQLGANAEVRRALFVSNRQLGVTATDPGSQLFLQEVVIRDTRSQDEDNTEGSGLDLRLGARAEVRKGLFERNRFVGVLADDDGTELFLEDVVVRDTRSQASDRSRGAGLVAQEGALAEVRRAIFERNRRVGIQVAEAQVLLEDAIIRDTESDESRPNQGFGLALYGARADVRRVVLAGNRGVSIFAAGPEARLVLEDAEIIDTQSLEAEQSLGRGLELGGGAAADVRRSVFARNRDIGVFADGDATRLTLEDTVVRDTESQVSDQKDGSGIGVQQGASLEARRALLVQNRDTAVWALDSTATLTDVSIDGVRLPSCVESPSPCIGLAAGVLVLGEQASIVLDRTRVARADQCGVFPVLGGQLDGTDVLIADNSIGACFDDASYDIRRLGAKFVNNGERVVYQNLPPPPESLPVTDPVRD